MHVVKFINEHKILVNRNHGKMTVAKKIIRHFSSQSFTTLFL